MQVPRTLVAAARLAAFHFAARALIRSAHRRSLARQVLPMALPLVEPTLSGFVSYLLPPLKKSPLRDFLMVAAAGLEPTAHSLGNCCSILMSYAANLFYFIKSTPQFCKHKFYLRQ